MKLKPISLGLVALLAGLLGGAFALGEWRGWPWLAEPLERNLSARLGREVRLLPDEAGGAAPLHLSLWGGVHVRAGLLRIGGPSWRFDTPTLSAEDVELKLRYRDLWNWRGKGTLNVRLLRAREINADLWRDEQGRATWVLERRPGAAPADPAAPPLLKFEQLALDGGRIAVQDKLLQINAHVDFALGQREGDYSSLVASAQGHYRGKPMRAWLQSASPLPWLGKSGESVPLSLELRAGNAALDFKGHLREPLGLQGLSGNYRLAGPSLAAIGDPLGITLPTTAAFSIAGQLRHEGARWQTEVERALLGRSRLNGSFVYASDGARPKLMGRLGGESLWFADLGPTIGTAPAPARPGEARAPARAGGKVLPDRQFDLPSLRAMDANVAVALDRVDLGSAFAEQIAPVRGRLTLQDGVLTLSELDARTASGQLAGRLSLDGRAQTARWDADLRWAGVALERWIKQGRAKGQPPYVSGSLNGRLQLAGQGRSAAELLASSSGRVQAFLPRGSISHLAVEAAGIDVAQSLGIWVRGDDALPLSCAVADLGIAQGRVVPRALVLDTEDSTLWMDGSLSLVSEQMDLRLQVAPKDFSPLSLRSPVHVGGSLGDPQLSLQAKPLMKRLLPAALLATLNPLAAILPLIDTGNTQADQQMLSACRKLIDSAQARALQRSRPSAVVRVRQQLARSTAGSN
ncbi:MAG: AsmA family protein [Burkholderiaceae bacterium]